VGLNIKKVVFIIVDIIQKMILKRQFYMIFLCKIKGDIYIIVTITFYILLPPKVNRERRHYILKRSLTEL